MKKKIHIDVRECEVRFRSTDPEDPEWSEDDALRYLTWWVTVGKHSNFFRAVLLDNRASEIFQTSVVSPTFLRDDPENRAAVEVEFLEFINRIAACREKDHPA